MIACLLEGHQNYLFDDNIVAFPPARLKERDTAKEPACVQSMSTGVSAKCKSLYM